MEQLQVLPHFTKSSVYQLGGRLGLKNTTIDTYISRFLKSKEILTLKKGLYVSADFFEKNRLESSYVFYLANILRTPSYVSSWAALQYYNLATEVIHSITSVTTKVTKRYLTKAGDFSYQSITPEFFSDFSLEKGKFDFFIASPAKAVFDVLYFRTRQFRGVRMKHIKALLEDLRIDSDDLEVSELKKLYAMIKKFL